MDRSRVFCILSIALFVLSAQGVPVDQPAEIPVKVVSEPVATPAKPVEVPVVNPAKSLPQEAPVAVPTTEAPVAPIEAEAPKAETPKEVEAAPANATLLDTLKSEVQAVKQKFSLKALKKVGQIRLVNGFRAAALRPKISLDSQKEAADSLRKSLFERRNKYEKFVENVLGKASPTGAKQPAPGYIDQQDDSCSRDDGCDDDYDSCESDSCDSDSDSDSDEDDDDDCDSDEDELEPGEGEAVWVEEEIDGAVQITEECPDDEDDCDDDSCEDDDDDDYEYEDGIESTDTVSASSSSEEDDCDDSDSCSDSSDSSDGCDDDDDECKKKKKQQQINKKKQQKKKKNGNKKSSSKNGSGKNTDGKTKKKTTDTKKKVYYKPVQKIRTRALHGNTTVTRRRTSRKGAVGNAASGLQNAVLNKVDDLFSIKDNGLFNKNKNSNSDTNTGCSIVEGWTCPRQGRFAHPIDCQKYVTCSKSGVFSKELTNTVYECEDDESYDPSTRSCTTDWSSCEALEQCLYHRQLIEDPSDDNSYFICIKDTKKFKESYTLYRRDCTPGRTFDPDYQLCVDDDDYKRITKAKKKRQSAKKQKYCEDKKKKNKNQKKKSPSKKH